MVLTVVVGTINKQPKMILTPVPISMKLEIHYFSKNEMHHHDPDKLKIVSLSANISRTLIKN